MQYQILLLLQQITKRKARVPDKLNYIIIYEGIQTKIHTGWIILLREVSTFSISSPLPGLR